MADLAIHPNMKILRFHFVTHSLFLVFVSFPLHAQEEIRVKNRYYGVFEARQFEQFKNVQNLKPESRRVLDLREIEAEVELRLNPDDLIEIGVEYEHGGTGSTLEYDNFEEFGEFENETERGGEVAISEAFYRHRLFDGTYVTAGKAPLYFSLNSALDAPGDSSSSRMSNLEARMLPPEWKEVGVQAESRLGDFTLRAGLVSGLNSEFFRKYNWVGGGHQKQFERINADGLAGLLSLEYGDALRGRGVALGVYRGDAAGNRHKRDKLAGEAVVTLYSLMASWTLGPVVFTGQVLRGGLSHSEAVVAANNTLGGLAKPGNFGAIGSRAELEAAQLSWNFRPSWSVFAQYEHVNTFAGVQGSVFADPRYDVQQRGVGVFHHWDYCFLKLQAWRETTRLEGLPATQTVLLQFGFDTKEI